LTCKQVDKEKPNGEKTEEIQEAEQDDYVEGPGADATKDLRRFMTAKD